MPLEQTVTIVNNSGKIISTGKQLFSIFKEAKASYDEKKAEIRGLKRSETFDSSRSLLRQAAHQKARGTHEPGYYTEHDYGRNPPYHDGARRPLDARSDASSRKSGASSRSRSKPPQHGSGSRPALTESNLRTLSEVSSTPPSKAPPNAYRSPYAETLPRDMLASRMDLLPGQLDAKSAAETEWARGRPAVLPRRRSESDRPGREPSDGRDVIDMDLAYGNIPPDLEYRLDLDPARQDDEHQANQLIRRVEGLLDEAHCVQHSAASIIKHLQEKPDAAAAVALTLAELSSVVGQMSPAFLGLLKGASPAVFALLASPQFLIGTGIAVGLTVVMFGGWKIVKRVREQQSARETLAWQGAAAARPAPLRTQSDFSTGVDEALVVDEELSAIDTWRRGIMPPGADDESADVELITPVAERAQRAKYKDDLDVRSHRSTRTTATSRTAKTAKTAKSSKTSKTSQTHRTSGKAKEREASERHGGRNATVESVAGDSELGPRKSSHRDRDRDRDKERPKERGARMLEDGRGSSSRSRSSSSSMELVFRPKAQSLGDNMLKALFKSKDRKERLVMT